MPSPFLGMDPFLEDPGLWPNVHHGLISEIQAVLNRSVRPKYFARVEERVYISDDDDPGRKVIVPDVQIANQPDQSYNNLPAGQAGTLTVTEPLIVYKLLDDEIHEPRVEVVDRASQQVVAVIEVVSPTNKVSGSAGRESYLAKRREVLHSPSHWLEIDLLRAGRPIFNRALLPPCEYVIHLSRAEDRRRHRAWPVRLQGALPVIAVPLRGEDPDVPLDLKAVLESAYDRGAYDAGIDYRRDPDPTLPPELAAWADQLLRERGLRPTPPA
jgi:hypothetical protein